MAHQLATPVQTGPEGRKACRAAPPEGRAAAAGPDQPGRGSRGTLSGLASST